MRFVVFGAGAVGGVVGARLHQAGHDVALIARGAHLAEIQRAGLTLETPSERSVVQIPAAADPAELGVGTSGTDDVILLATKSQDTGGALDALQRAGAWAVPIVCMQNGVENERVALRRFANVYGAVVMAPTAHLRPGAVVDDLAGRWTQIGVSDIDGRKRAGSSTWQSLARGTGAVETDYLNGEIVLVGRLHGVPTPVNAALCRLAAEQARGGAAPGELSVDDILAVAA